MAKWKQEGIYSIPNNKDMIDQINAEVETLKNSNGEIIGLVEGIDASFLKNFSVDNSKPSITIPWGFGDNSTDFYKNDYLIVGLIGLFTRDKEDTTPMRAWNIVPFSVRIVAGNKIVRGTNGISIKSSVITHQFAPFINLMHIDDIKVRLGKEETTFNWESFQLNGFNGVEQLDLTSMGEGETHRWHTYFIDSFRIYILKKDITKTQTLAIDNTISIEREL